MDKARELIDAAMAKGIITLEQHRQMELLADINAMPNPEERFRVVNGFSEIFVSIGLLILFSALNGVLGLFFSDPLFVNAAVASIGWFTACFFTARHRMLLPAIISCLATAGYVWFAFADTWLADVPMSRWGSATLPLWHVFVPVLSSLAVLILAAWRFRIPFLMLPIGVVFTLAVNLPVLWGSYSAPSLLILGACGLALLATALRFDFKDPERVRASSDFAFWCYVLGSPLAIHSLFLTLIGTDILSRDESAVGVGLLALMVVLITFITCLSLLINRRALILSTLVYFTFSVGYVLQKALGAEMAITFSMLVVGLYIVCLGTIWKRVRRKLMTHLGPREWFSKLPPY